MITGNNREIREVIVPARKKSVLEYSNKCQHYFQAFLMIRSVDNNKLVL